MVRVLPDEPAIAKVFDYLVPPSMADDVRVGSVVRVALQGRRVRGWVVADHVTPPPGVELQPLAKVTGWGPPPEVLDLAEWTAWRWAGRPASVLRTATSDHAVRAVPRRRPAVPPPVAVAVDEVHELAAEALAGGAASLRLPPAADVYPVLVAAAALGPVLVVAPVGAAVRHLALRLRRGGVPVSLLPDGWPAARGGGVTVLGTRAAALAPLPEPAAVVVLDEHDESLQQEQAPTWHAREVAVERARRAGAPCVLVSPTPSLEALALADRVVVPSRRLERDGWPRVEVVDRRKGEPGEGLYSERLVAALREGGRVVCVLNRKGRSRLLRCATCDDVATCERCEAAVVQGDGSELVCQRCGTHRPVVCLRCGGTRMKNIRVGVSRAREELEALARRPVVELTGDARPAAGGPGAEVVVGTEAALHQADRADVVAFLDFDQELLAPRYRAAEEALALLVLGSRLVGGRSGGGRLVVQTRLPHHEVVQAALLADPSRVSTAEAERRRSLGFPPATAMAAVSGAAAPAWIDAFEVPSGVEVLGPADGRWLVRAPDHATLCDALASVPRPAGRLRIEVDPQRL